MRCIGPQRGDCAGVVMSNTTPEHVSLSLGALLANVTRRCFTRRFVGAGLLAIARTEGGRPHVRLTDLEGLLQRRFSADDILRAERQLDKGRAKQRQYRAALAVKRRGYP